MSEQQQQTAPAAGSEQAKPAEGSLIDQTTSSSAATTTTTATDTTSKPTATPADPESLAGGAKDESGAPETYADFTFAEGLEVSDEAKTEFTALAKTLNLTQTQAQALVDFQAKLATSAPKPEDTVATMRKEWRDSVLADTTLSANGALKTEVKAALGRAIDSLPPADAKAFREAMNLTGAGDHPAFVKAFHIFAQRLAEGKPVVAGKPAPVANPNKPSGPGAHALYPTAQA